MLIFRELEEAVGTFIFLNVGRHHRTMISHIALSSRYRSLLRLLVILHARAHQHVIVPLDWLVLDGVFLVRTRG